MLFFVAYFFILVFLSKHGESHQCVTSDSLYLSVIQGEKAEEKLFLRAVHEKLGEFLDFWVVYCELVWAALTS